MDVKSLGQIILLAMLWGASFLFLRIAGPAFGPFALIFVRTAVAALFLLPFIFFTRQQRVIVLHWRTFLLLGAFSIGLPFTLLSYAALHLTAGHTSMLNAVTPMFAAVAAYLWLQERLAGLALLGIVIGFLGVFVLSFEKGGMSITRDLLPSLAGLGAALFYGMSSCIVKIKLNEIRPLTIAAGTQCFAAFWLSPWALFFWPDQAPEPIDWLNAVCLGVFCTALALVLFFNIMRTQGVTKTVSVTYLIPVFAFLWGAIFLGEAISVQIAIGGLLVLIGVGFTTGALNIKKLKKYL